MKTLKSVLPRAALIFLIFTGGLSTVLGFATNGILNFLSNMALSPVRFFAELF